MTTFVPAKMVSSAPGCIRVATLTSTSPDQVVTEAITPGCSAVRLMDWPGALQGWGVGKWLV